MWGCWRHGEMKGKGTRDTGNQHNKGLILISLGQSCGCGHTTGMPHWKNVAVRRGRAIVLYREWRLKLEKPLDPSSLRVVTLPVELWLVLESIFSAFLRLPRGKMQKASRLCFLLPHLRVCLLPYQREIKLGWHDWLLTNPCSLILFIILHLTSCSFNTFF